MTGTRGHQRPRRTGPTVPDLRLPRDVLDEVRRTAHPRHTNEATDSLADAVEKLETGDPAAAVPLAEKAKALASRSATAREVLGLSYYGVERFRDALREMQAYRRMSGRLDQNHIIADCHRALGAHDKAAAAAEEALAATIADEAKAEAVVVGASALADTGRYPEALALIRRFRSRPDVARPFDLRVWYVTGDILARAGRLEESAKEFRRVVEHDPTAFDAADRLAQLG
jgi:tetratricopeptide (TPR) repeat protein